MMSVRETTRGAIPYEVPKLRTQGSLDHRWLPQRRGEVQLAERTPASAPAGTTAGAGGLGPHPARAQGCADHQHRSSLGV